ncbi:MAG: hypothetical protein JWO52_3845, partial [Gammaproteobacteria bacterium]|nr:hypothetical protein [Gammaproteobacteria bacterium]
FSGDRDDSRNNERGLSLSQISAADLARADGGARAQEGDSAVHQFGDDPSRPYYNPIGHCFRDRR